MVREILSEEELKQTIANFESIIVLFYREQCTDSEIAQKLLQFVDDITTTNSTLRVKIKSNLCVDFCRKTGVEKVPCTLLFQNGIPKPTEILHLEISNEN